MVRVSELTPAIERDKKIAEVLKNVERLPDRIRIGFEIIYPERQQEYLNYLFENTKNGNCSFIDSALQIMLLLNSGISAEEASILISPNEDEQERNMVYLFSKRGPEFFIKTSKVPFEQMDSTVKEQILTRMSENDKFAKEEQSAVQKNLKKSNY